MHENNELRHCPFCGNDVKVEYDEYNFGTAVYPSIVCDGCDLVMYSKDLDEGGHEDEEALINRWNKRVFRVRR